MKFSVLYKNETSIRDQVIALLASAISQGHDLGKQGISHPLFSTQPLWPRTEVLVQLPLNNQCEELEYTEGSFKTRRQLVLEAEIISSVIQVKEEVINNT